MKVLGFDTETTGLNAEEAHIIEIGAVLFDVHDGAWTPLKGMSRLVYEPHFLPLPPEAMAINHITDDMLLETGVPFLEALEELQEFAREAQFIVAHNAGFDKGMLKAQLVRRGTHSFVVDLPFICSKTDVEAHSYARCTRLGHLALDYGVAVNPSELHRAMEDVLLMGKMLTAAKADPSVMWKFHTTPTLVVSTEVVPPWEDSGRDRDDAKKVHGYVWENIRGIEKSYKKQWVKAFKNTPANLAAQTRKYRILEEI